MSNQHFVINDNKKFFWIRAKLAKIFNNMFKLNQNLSPNFKAMLKVFKIWLHWMGNSDRMKTEFKLQEPR